MTETENLELEKTLQVNGQTYNINAVEADKVANKLAINRIALGTKDNKTTTPVTDFDGSAAKSVTIVPANEGGRFAKRITVPHVEDSTLKDDGETVLNYTDIVGKVVDRLLNTSAMATWNGNKLSFTDTETPAVHGICVVLGDEANVGDFANENYSSKRIPNYLYICKDTGNIYLGSADSTETKILSGITANEVLTPKRIEVAANQWVTKATDGESDFGLDMANSDLINLNGLFFSDYANLNNEGLNFIQTLNTQAKTSDIRDPGIAATLVYDRVYARDGKFYFTPNCKIRNEVQEDIVDENGDPVYTDPNPFEVYHSGLTIPTSNGGTGADSLEKITVGNAKKAAALSGYDGSNLRELTAATVYSKLEQADATAQRLSNALEKDTTIAKQARTITTYGANNAILNSAAKITIAPSASYPNGPTGGNNGDIMILF